jgi:hypothetical protein
MLTDTALVITAHKRPEYLHTVFRSWAAARRVDELRMVAVALGQSHRYDDQVDIIKEAEDMLGRHIVILRDSPDASRSPGMHRALGEAIDRLFGDFQPQWALCGEEDVIVSDDVLEYVDWAQRQADSSTLCICAHNQGGAGWDGLERPREDADADQAAVRRAPYFSPWVWAIARPAWETIARPVWDWDCDAGGPNTSGYDWQMQGISSVGPWHNLVPAAARSQTIGEHGGVYSTPGIFAMQQAQSFRLHRDPPAGYFLVDSPAG